MTEKTGKIYEFEDFCLETAEQILSRNGEIVAVTPKVFDLLVVLVKNHGHLLSKDELVKALWADSFVEEANLNVTVSALRRVLGERPNDHRYIETVPRRGYRFVAEVREITDESAADDVSVSDQNFTEAETISIDLPAKSCPKCKKLYYDKTLNFCLDDGEALSAETFSTNKSLSVPFQNKSKLFLLFGGILVAAIAGILVWKFSFQSETADVSNIQTLAVLPFKPLANNQSDSALEIGMADALITKLSSVRQITVRPTSAVSKYTEAGTDPVAAGRELQVEAVLDGKIQRADNKIRVTVQLLRVSDGTTLWAETFDDFFTNIFAVQDSISEKLTSSLALKLSGREKEQLAKRYTENTEAYALLLQARYFHEKLTKENTLKALEYYQAAIDKDPNYALAYTSRAGAYGFLANLNINPEENRQKARDTVMKALSLDPNLGETYADLADIQSFYDWNFTEAEKNYRKAVELAPNAANVHLQYSTTLTVLGRHDEAIAEAKKAVQINPVSPIALSFYLRTLTNARRYEETIVEGKKSLVLMPNERLILGGLIRAYIYNSMFAEAEALLPKFLEQNPINKNYLKSLIYLNTGRKTEAEKILHDEIAEYKEGDNCFNIAMNYAALGDKEKTIEFLEKAFQRRESSITHLAILPEFDDLHSDPRFQDLLKKIGLPQ